MSSVQVLIAGAGPAGLALAIKLRQSGIAVRMLERLARDRMLADAGGAYELSATTVNHLEALQVLEEVRLRGLPLLGFELRSHHDRVLQRLDFARAGFELLSITRAELQRALWTRVDALGIDLMDGVTITSVTEDEDAVRVTLSSGETIAADVLIGADGMHSLVRRTLFDPAPPIDVGIAAYWGYTPFASADLDLARGRSLGFVGVGGSLVITRNSSNDAWLFTLCLSDPERSVTLAEGAASLPARARALVENASRTAATRLYEQKPLREWTTRRTILIGDAAHGMTPFLGLGANSAIEDACRFGALLTVAPVEPAAWRTLAHARRNSLNPRIAEARRLGAMMCSRHAVAHGLFRTLVWAIPSALVLRNLRAV